MSCAARRACAGRAFAIHRQARPGDSIFVLPTCRILRKSTPPRTKCWNASERALAGEAIAINLDIEPVEKPETVLGSIRSIAPLDPPRLAGQEPAHRNREMSVSEEIRLARCRCSYRVLLALMSWCHPRAVPGAWRRTGAPAW